MSTTEAAPLMPSAWQGGGTRTPSRAPPARTELANARRPPQQHGVSLAPALHPVFAQLVVYSSLQRVRQDGVRPADVVKQARVRVPLRRRGLVGVVSQREPSIHPARAHRASVMERERLSPLAVLPAYSCAAQLANCAADIAAATRVCGVILLAPACAGTHFFRSASLAEGDAPRIA
jgi:hypothetical protein